MTDKQIIIDYKNLCENYSKEVGCYYTFDGNCNKEQCFTYKLLQLLQAKEQECDELKHKVELMMDCASCKVDEYKQTLVEIKEIAEKRNYLDYNECLDDILQKISDCEVENAR